MSVLFEENVAYLPGAESTVFFAADKNTFGSYATGTPAPVKKLVNALDIAPWGEDNRFPQNVVALMDSYGAGKAALDYKARALWGNGILPVTIDGYNPDGTEILKPLDRAKYAAVYAFIETQHFKRFSLEFLLDWAWFNNCFPELILSNDNKTITGIVHQESCDVRFKQMDIDGKIDTVYISKLWGMAKDQFIKFNKNTTFQNIMEHPKPTEVDNKFVKKLRALDMYNPVKDLQQYAATLPANNGKLKSVILPVNYPSPNKTYYQLANWDGARQAGWIDIAIKIPTLIKTAFNNAFHVKYHIEIPEKYMERRIGTATWNNLKIEEKKAERKKLILEMDAFLKGAEKVGSALVTFFDSDPHSGNEYNRVKIASLDEKSNVDKDLLLSASANSEFYFATQLNPDMLGASIPGGAYGGNKGGSNIRESKLVYDAGLNLERQITLEPLYVIRDYNQWGPEVQFRHRDTVLTTLDTGAGTKKVVS